MIFALAVLSSNDLKAVSKVPRFKYLTNPLPLLNCWRSKVIAIALQDGLYLCPFSRFEPAVRDLESYPSPPLFLGSWKPTVEEALYLPLSTTNVPPDSNQALSGSVSMIGPILSSCSRSSSSSMAASLFSVVQRKVFFPSSVVLWYIALYMAAP